MNGLDAYSVVLLALVIWREARGEIFAAKQAVAWSIRNRVKQPRWWGHDWETVILAPKQYSSFNRTDPNAVKWPVSNDPNWVDAMNIAQDLYCAAPTLSDNSQGADSYFDKSLDSNPPSWAATATHTADVGDFHFYKTVVV